MPEKLMASIDQLPEGCLGQIFGHLSAQDFGRAQLTCKRWSEVAASATVSLSIGELPDDAGALLRFLGRRRRRRWGTEGTPAAAAAELAPLLRGEDEEEELWLQGYFEGTSVDAHVLSLLAAACPQLSSLDLSMCPQVDEDTPRAVARLFPNLKSFGFKCLKVPVDSQFSPVAGLGAVAAGCRQLEALSLPYWITDAQLRDIWPGLSSTLRKLDLSQCMELGQYALLTVGRAPPRIQELDCFQTQMLHVEDWGSTPLPAGLTALKLGWNKQTSEVLATLAGGRALPRLTTVWALFVDGDQIDLSVIARLSQKLPNLRELLLGECGRVGEVPSGQGRELQLSFGKLQVLSLPSAGVTDGVLGAIARAAPRLQSLGLGLYQKESHVTDAGLQLLAMHCRQLAALDIHSKLIRGRPFALGFGNLRHLILGSTPIGRPGLLAIAQGCPNLEELGLWNCRKFSGEALKPLVDLIPGLHELDLTGCKQIKLKSAGLIASWKPALHLTGLEESTRSHYGVAYISCHCKPSRLKKARLRVARALSLVKKPFSGKK